MSLVIKNDEALRMAQELATLTGASMEDAVTKALAAQLERQREVQERLAKMQAIVDGLNGLPILDHRSEDEILGYNEHGHFD
jgi:antitoxin VapB